MLLNQGNRSFAAHVDYAAASSPEALALGDLNGDGRPDVVATSYLSSTLSVWFTQGAGALGDRHDILACDNASGVAIADVNGDGTPDLLATSASGYTLNVMLGHGDGTFDAPVAYPGNDQPSGMALGDFDRDGNLDVAVSNAAFANSVSLYLGHGDGTFSTPFQSFPTGALPNGLVALDLDRDGKLDLVTANAQGDTASVLLGNGDGTFALNVDVPLCSAPAAIASGDLDGDGTPDLAGACDPDQLGLLLNPCTLR